MVIISDSSPTFSYMSIFKEIRQLSEIPILIILDSKEKTDLIRMLNSGADVCLIDPIGNDELLARIESVLRRSKLFNHDVVHFKNLIWNETSYELRFHEHPISLAPKEFKILGYFLNHPNQIITHQELVSGVWGMKAAISQRTIHSYIRNVRNKLRRVDFPIDNHLVTAFGIGYRWDTQGYKEQELLGVENASL